MKDMSFSEGPSLPKGLLDAASVPFGDSFVLVGGIEPSTQYDSADILYYNLETNGWDIMGQQLQKARSALVAFPLDHVPKNICFAPEDRTSTEQPPATTGSGDGGGGGGAATARLSGGISLAAIIATFYALM